MADDILRDFELMALEMGPKSPEDWRLLTLRLRQKWGGERVYVLKAPAEGKAWRCAESLAAGANPREALETAGIHPGTGYARRFVMRWRLV